ncbi:MAG: hypothetical protein PVG78_02865 [Desulfobacterales bacterium]|jgi:hypothetical protein
MTDYDSPLTDEILSDVAQTFFGARKKLDDMIEILDGFVGALRQKADAVQQRAGLLHFLLVDEQWVVRFYSNLGVDDPGDLSGAGPPEPLPKMRIPFALTGNGRFAATVAELYRRLAKSCREYRCSSANPFAEAENPEEACVDVRMVKAMRELINEKIHAINEESSPSAILQYAKGFDARGEKRSAVAGATAGEYAGMDQKYVYLPIPVERLGFKRFPELPRLKQCRTSIDRFCKEVYPKIEEEVRRRLFLLKRGEGAD